MSTPHQEIREKWQKFVELQVWQGEDEYTKNMAVGNVADWWLNEVDSAFLAGQRSMIEQVREKIEEYFKGLIMIPFPEKTKDKLLSSLQTLEDNIK